LPFQISILKQRKKTFKWKIAEEKKKENGFCVVLLKLLQCEINCWQIMLKPSRTWPSILTMAVVQLKFDQKGKYSYSTIANINQSHKQQLIENHIPIVNNGHVDYKSESQYPHNGHKKDLITRKNASKSRSLSSNGSTANGRQQNAFHHHHNGNSLGCANSSPGKNGKVCLCELEFRDNNRKRSESIKVDNWDYIFKEKAFNEDLDLPQDERNVIPK
jgi:hypothetical protein